MTGAAEAAGVAVAPLGVKATAVVATAFVGVPGVPTVGTVVVPAALVVIVAGVAGVPPFATVVWAAAVCFANSSIIAIGFSTEGKGETNNPVGITVGVAAGAEDNDCVQAEINKVEIAKMKITTRTRCL